jgi:hypothetical protein
MYDIPFFTPTRKEMAVVILGVFIFLVAVFSAGYMLGVRNVHDNGSGTQPIANELGQAGTAIENAGAGIEAAAGHAGNVQAGIDNATEQAEYIYGTAKTSTELIGQCKSIIENIRRRGKADKVTN